MGGSGEEEGRGQAAESRAIKGGVRDGGPGGQVDWLACS